MKTEITIVPETSINRVDGTYVAGGMKFIKTIYADDNSVVLSVEIPAKDAALEVTPELLAEYIADSRQIFKDQIDTLFDMFQNDSSVNIAMGGGVGASLTKTLYDYIIIRGTIYEDD